MEPKRACPPSKKPRVIYCRHSPARHAHFHTVCGLLSPRFGPPSKAVLMERRIVVCSNDLGAITSVILIMDQLIYPFAWQHTYIPMMPPHVKEVCCAMMPYLIGIHKSLEDGVMEILLEDSDDFVIVDLDAKQFRSYGNIDIILTHHLDHFSRTSQLHPHPTRTV